VRALVRPFIELQIAMAVGALACFLVGHALRASTTYATVYRPGTVLYFLGDVLFLTVPVIAWMTLWGRGWRHSLELAAAMLAPVTAIVVLGVATEGAYLLWLINAMYPVMSLGMAVWMLCRKEVFSAPGEPAGIRTRNQGIKSPLLYR
jgi:hypothetical protein